MRAISIVLLFFAGCRTQLLMPADDGGGVLTDASQRGGDLATTTPCSSYTNASDCTSHGCKIAGCPDCQGGTTFLACYAPGDPPPPFGCPAGCAVPVDSAVNQCAQDTAALQQYLDSHIDCQSTSDCTSVSTGCGLPGGCGAYLASSAVAGLNPLVDKAKADNCTGPCPPCAAPAPVTCNNNQCVGSRF